ncbi:hypothetical protein ACQPYE_00995 [Actinosynnema sp. CA-299493]
MSSHDNPKVAAEISAFAYRLRRARRDAGEPSLRELARRIQFQGSVSTLQRAFAGGNLPTWRVVEALLITGLGLDRERVQQDWRPVWVAIKDLQDPLEPPAPVADAAGDASPTRPETAGLARVRWLRRPA